MITKEQVEFILKKFNIDAKKEFLYAHGSPPIEEVYFSEAKIKSILSGCVVKPAPEFSSLHDSDQHCVTITIDQKDKMIELQFHNTQEYEKNSEWFTAGELTQLRDNINKILEYLENENH